MAEGKSSMDALIVGGGPGGLAAAIALCQNGLDCLVVDAVRPPIEKGCGEGLMPDALTALRQLGVEIGEGEGHRLAGIRYLNPRHTVDAPFPGATGIGVRRTHLHTRMHERAREAGARFAWGSHARLLPGGGVSVDGTQQSFRWLVGGDGTRSRLRGWAGLDATRTCGRRFGFRRHYRVAPWSDFVEIYWGASGQVYITPVARDQISLVFITRQPETRGVDFLDLFPEVRQKLQGAEQITPQRGAISETRRLRQVAIGKIALIGDASGSADAITGEGLAMTFRQANALAASIAEGSLDLYRREHEAIARLPHAMSRLMLLMDRWPGLQRHGMRALASNSSLFEGLLSVHMGNESLPRFALRRAPAIGRSLLAG